VITNRDKLGRIKKSNHPRRNWHRDRFIPSICCVEKECPACFVKFYLPPSKIKNQVCCSAECGKMHRKSLREKRRCECENCGKVFYPRQTQVDKGIGKFCSKKCHGIGVSGDKNKLWKGGQLDAQRRFILSGGSKIVQQNRRARKKYNGGRLSKGLSNKLYKLQRGKCACCGKSLGDDYHLDHRMPLALGGVNEDLNMQLLRSKCNREKHAKHPIDFMQSRGFLL